MAACATIYSGQCVLGEGVAPGRPGGTTDWLPANKTGFGTSRTSGSKVWFTLQDGRLSEVYYPRIDVPSVRNLDFIVTDGQSFTMRAQDAPTSTRLTDPDHSLTYQIVNTDVSGRWSLVTTFVTDPARPTLLIDVEFTSLDGKPYQLYTLYRPQLNNPALESAATPPVKIPLNESGLTQGDALLATDAQEKVGSALVASPAFNETSTGYLDVSDGWTDLRLHHRLTAHYDSAPNGTVVQTGRLPLTGLPGSRYLTLALGFGSKERLALTAAEASLKAGFDEVAESYAAGWERYVETLHGPPSSLTTIDQRRLYSTSAMVLAASEDKTYQGAFVASPTMPWEFGTGLETRSDVYHLVWSRDLYEIATGLIADGDAAGAGRALDFLFNVQQKPDGSFPQNSHVDGAPVWGGLQLDEVGDPIILAYQLGRKDKTTWTHVKRAADFLVAFVSADGHPAPYTPGERWENQGGYSPSSTASEIAGLVCAAEIARDNGDAASARLYLATADYWQSQLENWMVTPNGPYSRSPYYVRLTKDANPDLGTVYSLGDGGPSSIDQRKVVDAGFLELVRLGIKPASNQVILNSLKVVDVHLATATPTGLFWHRYNFDGYGETATGAPWHVTKPDTFTTHGRLWPIFAGERGEYDLAAANLAAAKTNLDAMGRTANEGSLLPEQVWDRQPPSGQNGFAPGTPTTSATPLAWTHAQFIRLAVDLAAGRVLEQPAIVADRYSR